MAIEFLELAEVLEIHQDQIERYGGTHGMREIGLLESALAMPRAGLGGEYFHSDVFEMAAAYLFHIVKNHPFVDGNKRVGAAAAIVFLLTNGIDVRIRNESLVALVLGVATGKRSKAEVAAFFKRHSE
ncbi:MAG TPA: type II toxin-antitoxin system death-on-curing family toxin [Planctomycetota bacterium]|nr:type II toxin-antitoxin system death-on-curing family toxin [Planctomycetota bacterium]